MQIEKREDCLIIHFIGELDYLSTERIKDVLITLINQEQKKVVKFDFRRVSFVDSTGLGMILGRYKQIKNYGGELIVMDLNRHARKIFEMTGILDLIKEEKDGVIV